MDISKVPVGSSVVVADNAYIKSTFRRVSQGEGLLELSDPASGKVVLRSKINMNTGGQSDTWFDAGFWNVLVDGKPIQSGAGAAQGAISWEPQTRTINITTR